MDERKTIWQQLVDKRQKFIGGQLEDLEYHDYIAKTKIVDMDYRLQQSGDSYWFEVKGVDFTCGFDCGHGGITPGEKGWLTFCGYGGHVWRIKGV